MAFVFLGSVNGSRKFSNLRPSQIGALLVGRVGGLWTPVATVWKGGLAVDDALKPVESDAESGWLASEFNCITMGPVGMETRMVSNFWVSELCFRFYRGKC